MTLAVLLSGQGGQHPGMFDLTADHPAAQDVFAQARPLLGADPREVARAGGEGHMIPEQVWDDRFPPSGEPGFPEGEPTLSASPLAWSHAQFVRLAWSIDAGHPVERPSVVACRYAGCN